jgi:hypothetical protein
MYESDTELCRRDSYDEADHVMSPLEMDLSRKLNL